MKLYITYVAISSYVANSLLFRCESVDAENLIIPKPCETLYSALGLSDVMYFKEDTIPGLRKVLNDTYTFLPYHFNASSYLDDCSLLIGNYLCAYYFPLCREDRNQIYEACSSSCNILFNNEECSNLFKDTINFIAEQNITILPDTDSCATTYRPLGFDQPDEASFCLSIEG